jgi:Protein of unknown function (DUF2786)
MSDPKREKAISKVHSLDQLANHPNTPPHEAESARAMAKKLREKYNIPEPRKEAPRANPWDAQRFEDEMRRAQEWRERAARVRRDQEAERIRREQREAWQRAKDEALKAEEALRKTKEAFTPTGDPLEDAIRRDGRTAQQKNADMQDRLRGKTPPEPRCTNPESFFTSGGEPRMRNQYVMACEKCHGRLQPGEGAIMKVGGVWKAWCCEMKPGPRRKQPWAR